MMRDNPFRGLYVCLFILILLVFGCSGSGDGSNIDGNDTAGQDSVAPTIAGTTPNDGDTGVTLTSHIIVSFSEACDAATLTSNSFSLSGGGAIIPGTIRMDDANATFTPSSALLANILYTASVTTAVTDTAGNHLAADYSWSFTTTTTNTEDTTAPTIISTAPSNGDTGVLPNISVSVNLSEPCDPSSITTQNFTLSSGGTPVTGTVHVAGDSITFTPSAVLAVGTTYTATLSNGVTDVAGNHLASEFSWSFTTGDIIVPKRLPVGMNLPSLNYYTPSLIFTDVMTTASEMLTFYDDGGWNSEKISEIPRDENGWPTAIPYTTSDGHSTKVRFLVNNYYEGRHRILFDGTGSLGGHVISENDNYYLDLDGKGGHVWIDIVESHNGDHIHNMRILPQEYENGESYPLFQSGYLEGLRPFHALRFMDWIHTNNSTQVHWSERIEKGYYTQGGPNGISFDYAIDLANELDADAWVCVPHMASDDYIRKMARLFKDNLDPGRKIYLEHSNEVWNWMFSQSNWILYNGQNPDDTDVAVDDYVRDDLAAINSAPADHPEKDAYMMARTFRIWEEEFGAQASQRIVRVATGQHMWVDNTRRILEYLFNTDGIGCDAMSVAGYFNFNQEHHDYWLTQNGNVTPLQVIDAAKGIYESTTGTATRDTAAFVNSFNVDYLVYEGGQHMQPYNQGEWDYNHAVWDAQIHPGMYDLYNMNFKVHTEPEVNCKLFMAFSYIGTRESPYGSWGHIESLSQIGTDYMVTAPKYKALLDANTTR